jgi:hypothetical protein
MLLFVPETQRKIVGNGSAHVHGLYRTLFPIFQSPDVRRNRTEFKTPRHRSPNPFTSIKILGNKGSLLVIVITAVNYAVKMTLQTSLGAQCIGIYSLNFLEGGLIYLASGIGSGLGAFLTGISFPFSQIALFSIANTKGANLKQENLLTEHTGKPCKGLSATGSRTAKTRPSFPWKTYGSKASIS